MKEVIGFSGYFVDKDGAFFSNKQSKVKLLKPWFGTHRYTFITFSINGVTTKKAAHRIVAQTFLDNPLNKPDVNHKNGIRHDNRVENLEWVIKSENLIHSHRVLNQQTNAKKIRCVETNIVYKSAREAERLLGVNNANICSAIKGRTRQPRAGGYHWEYT